MASLIENITISSRFEIILEAKVPTINQLIRKGRQIEEGQEQSAGLAVHLEHEEAAPHPPG